MALQKKDFIEIEFTGRVKGGEVFDSNIKSELDKLGSKQEAKPFVFCLGQGMFLKGIDDFLIGKESGKSYKIELTPENAFGKRESNLVQMIPAKFFKEHNLNPVPGAVFNFDNKMGKVLSVSGGRILVDFNNPLAGKDLEYDLKILKKLEDLNEKIKAFNEFIFRQDFKFEVKDKRLTIKAEKPLVKFVEAFKDKFKELFDLELEVKEIEEKKEEKNEEGKKEEIKKVEEKTK